MTARSDVLFITDKTKLLKSALGQSDVKLVTQDVCITPESRHHWSSFILWIKHISLAVDHLPFCMIGT